MERYYGRIYLTKANGDRLNLPVRWFSYSKNIIEAGQGLLQFVYGIQTHQDVKECKITAVYSENEIYGLNKEDFYDIYDVKARQIIWRFLYQPEEQTWKGNTTHVG